MTQKKTTNAAKGCGCLCLLILGAIVLAAVNSPRGPQPAVAEKKWPYQFVDSKVELTGPEQAGWRSIMDLYAFSGNFDLAVLRAFCLDRKEHSTADDFYYVVIFDDASHAKFPSTPFTAEYGTEEDALRHIRAIYVYNRLNGFSQLQYYERNAWESPPKLEKI